MRHHLGRLSPLMVQLLGVSRRIISVAWFAPETWTLIDLDRVIPVSCAKNCSETGPEKGVVAAGARKAPAAGSLSLSRVGESNAAGAARLPEGFPSPGCSFPAMKLSRDGGEWANWLCAPSFPGRR